MGRMLNLLKKFFPKKQSGHTADVEELRNAFKDRYQHFRLLLNANSKALEIMTEIEEALSGTRPFGMTFVQSRCTSASINVWQIIKHLNELAQFKYEPLFERFKETQKKINIFFQSKNVHTDGPLAIPFASVHKELADQVGSKMANVGEIRKRMDLSVSNGFAITARAYQYFMEHNDLRSEIDRLIQATDVEHPAHLYGLSTAIQQMIIRSSLPEDLETAIYQQYRLLEEEEGEGLTVAMRSSALEEDLKDTSFAGQYRSVLNVSRESIFQAYKEIVASKYSLTAMSYRLNRGIRDEDAAMCVGCMAMVDALSGGVVYSSNPVNIRDDSIVINSVWGLPKAVVDGSTASDLYIIAKGDPMTIIRKEITVKKQKFICYPDEGVCRMDATGADAQTASLSDENALALARLALKLEAYYNAPQDIEWALQKDGTFSILQCRPLEQPKVERIRYQEAASGPKAHEIILSGGLTAGSGVGAGPVYILRKDMDILGFPQGAVLVTSQALPRWASVLNRAAAVVSEHGGITGHLASVAREFNVPALFGLNGAVKQLANDQLITVDADGRKVYEGRIEALLKQSKKPKNLMAGSPVFETLKGAARHITPLNLLDPDAPEFNPVNCNTFHDITRFCHEKAIHEMFQFGRDHHFPERSSKQLFHKVPMKWWILNLDDGFKKEIRGKYVQLEEIDSIPMLALWNGISAVPWGGPPPVDGRGFMSVMFQATANPALAIGVRSKYADRNYFMVSKNYCSLNSRLGFHFSTVEALVSHRARENYISFQFKGGKKGPFLSRIFWKNTASGSR